MIDPNSLLGTKLGNYRLERILGRGRMGIVYLARDEALLRATAIKLLSWTLPEAEGQSPEAWFIAEARHVARINHPHVVQIYSVAKQGTFCYIAMEYVNGKSADRWIAERGNFPPARATEILLQTAGALQAAHDAGIVHRDIKPENLLIAIDGHAKLGDFGMALHMHKMKPSDKDRAGTPYYTAPEIWRGLSASPATDIYALGGTYFYLLTGRPPFQTQDLPSLISAHLNTTPPDPREFASDIPEDCAQLIQRCLAKNPSDRYPSGQVLGWNARGLLRSFNLEEQLSTNLSQKQYAIPPLASPSQDLSQVKAQEAFGLVRPPFENHDITRLPYLGEPFSTLSEQLVTWTRIEKSAVMVMFGEPGTGRTTLARQLLSKRSKDINTAFWSPGTLNRTQSLAQQIGRSFGVVTTNSGDAQNDVNQLLLQLEHVQTNLSSPALLIFDDCMFTQESQTELVNLARAASLSHYFKIFIVTQTKHVKNLLSFLETEELLSIERLEVPQLTTPQAITLVESCLRVAREEYNTRPLFTPDGYITLAELVHGHLRTLILLTMLTLRDGAERGRLLLTSNDVMETFIKHDLTSVPSPTHAQQSALDLKELVHRGRKSCGLPQRQQS